MTKSWLGLYAAYDDAALTALANPGLLRRGRKEFAAGNVHLVSEEPKLIALASGPATIRITPAGPPTATCSCPTAGVCLHIVAACLWARDQAARAEPEPAPVPSQGPASSEGPASPSPAESAMPEEPASPLAGETNKGRLDPLEEILSLDPVVVMKEAGKAAVKRAAAAFPSAAAERSDACEIEADGPRLSIRWPGSPAIVYVAGGGMPAMVVSGNQQHRKALCVEALARVRTSQGHPWTWPGASGAVGAALTATQRAAITSASNAIEDTVTAGLSHVGAQAADRLSGESQRCRLAGLWLLHRLLATAAKATTDLARRENAVSEPQVLSDLSRSWALCYALQNAGSDRLPELVGSARRQTSGSRIDTDPARFVPLAAHWWTGRSGSRGMTFMFWDSQDRQIRTATTARAAGMDPGFSPDWDRPMLWGVSPSRACQAPFGLRGMEERPDGSLSVTERTALHRDSEVYPTDLLTTTAQGITDSRRSVVGTGFGPPTVIGRIHSVRDAGEVTVDEVRQEVIWTLVDSLGERRALRIAAAEARSIETLTKVLATRQRIVAVFSRRQGFRDEPLTLFLQARSGVTVCSLSMSPVGEYRYGTEWKAYQRFRSRVERFRERSGQAVAIDREGGPATAAGKSVGDVVDSLAATGRRSMGSHDRQVLVSGVRRLDELGLVTPARAVQELSAGIEASALLKARFILDRLAFLESSAYDG